MKRAFLLFSLCLILSPTPYAQTVRVLNLKDGLSNNYAQCILQDKQGYIWIGTHDGLNRYNGHDLKVYKHELGSSFIYSLMQDSKGRIWVGTSRGGINLYYPEEERFERLKIKDKVYDYLDGKDVYSLFEDNIHNIWVGTLQGLARIPPSMDTITWYENHMQDFSQTFTSVTTTEDQQLLLGSNLGLFTIDPQKETLAPKPFDAIPELKGVFVLDIKQDTHGALWIATDSKGIFKLDPDKKTLHNFSSAAPARLKSNQVWKLFIDNNGDVWATFINGGIYRYDKASENFVSYQEKISTEFNSQSITGILQDFNGNIWITSHGDGVCYFNPRKYVFEKYLSGQGKHDGGETSIVSAFFEDKSGAVWVGTDGEGLKKMSSGNKITNEFSLKDGLSSNVVLDFIEDEKKNMWLATWQGGVNVIDKKYNVVKVFDGKDKASFGLKVPDVKALLKDDKENIWMVTHGGGIVIYDTRNKKFIDPHTITAAFRPDAGRWGSDILQARNGDIWIASHAGLFRYSNNILNQYFPGAHENALSSSLVYCVFEDSKGNIWAGTNTSLEKYLPKKNGFENYSRNFAVPGNIKCLLEDEHGKLWLSTVNEIIEFDPDTKKIRHFNQSYNIQQGQFYECACLRTKAGKFYFGGTEGFNAFWPDSVKDDQTFSRVFINDLYLFNKRQTPNDQDGVLTKAMPFTSEVVLSHAQNVMSFEFLALNYSAFAKNLYSYKMVGFDKDWSPPSEARMATYTNLDPGEYTFQVRAVSLDQIVLSETALKLKVVPPFWKTAWFKTLAILVLGGLIVGFFLLRLRASKTKRLILQQLVAERTREVSDKNVLLETQTQDLQKKNEALITQEVKIREQANILAQQKDLLQQNNITLADLNTTKDRLFSIIAHDLRNPFTSLLGYTQLLNTEFNRYSDEEKQKLIRSLYHSSSSIYSLLENLLVWSKSQQNVLVFSPEKIFLKAIIEEHFDLMKDEAEKKDVTLQLAVENEIVFLADRNMFSIILRNLLFNALKYSPVHGSIKVTIAIEGTGLQLFIQDEGSGIEDGMELFEVSAVGKHRDHNHGLGLILCKEFVEKHGGKIKAVNNPDRGACFSFTLPSANAVVLETNDDIHLNNTVVSQQQATGEDVTSLPTVLVAEDDDEIRWYIKQILFPEFQVLESVNGADGDLLAQEKIPDVIISDLTMPKMDGLEFCRKIKSREQTSHIPFIMLTAERSNDKKVSGYHLGADDFITKPIQPNVLRARLHNIIDNRKRLKAIYQRDITSLPETFTTNTVDQSFLERLNAIIENQIANPELNPDSLAREVNMSRTGLYMKVKALTGESVGIYIRNVRLKESKKLLKTRKYNISEVAYAVGFNQLPYFTTCFKEAFGITPTEFIGKNGV